MHKRVSWPWFYYQWEDKYAAKNITTEDVSATRDIHLFGLQKLGHNPIHCAWDSWAAHYKSGVVEAPAPLDISKVGHKWFCQAQELAEMSHCYVDFTGGDK